MCGISGIFHPSQSVDPEKGRKLMTSLQHRGPDNSGEYFNHNIFLGHNRLSIMDLSDNASQPFISSNENFVLIYNGEIYNFQEIANEIRLHYGDIEFQFKTRSDTEVIVEAFSIWGIEALEKFNGMFAMALFDKRQNELYLIRDRIGIKPLYYHVRNNEIYFASELKAIKNALTGFQPNYTAINCFLSMGYVPPPYSILENVWKLEKGHYLKISASGIDKVKYWSVDAHISGHTVDSEKKAMVVLSDLLKSAVQYQLISDVPVGVFLSGGIDSSLIAAMASNMTSVQVNTFTIGFEDSKFNESVYARKIADYIGTNHHEFIVSKKDVSDLLFDCMDFYDEPFADSSAIPTMMVSRMARDHVKVTLSGEGGDELFHGYGSYRWANRLNTPLVRYNKNMIRKVLSRSGNIRRRRAAQYFDVVEEHLQPLLIFSAEQNFFSFHEKEKYFKMGLPPYSLFAAYKQPGQNRRLSKAEIQSVFDMDYYLPGDLLVKTDRASMKYSLETRVPYLDHRVIEFALNLSPSLKMHKGQQKYILKEILYQRIPQELFERPKQGFAIPLQSWLKNDFGMLIEEYLNESLLKQYPEIYADPKAIRKIIDRYRSGEEYLYSRIWLLICLNRWLTRFTS